MQLKLINIFYTVNKIKFNLQFLGQSLALCHGPSHDWQPIKIVLKSINNTTNKISLKKKKICLKRYN